MREESEAGRRDGKKTNSTSTTQHTAEKKGRGRRNPSQTHDTQTHETHTQRRETRIAGTKKGGEIAETCSNDDS